MQNCCSVIEITEHAPNFFSFTDKVLIKTVIEKVLMIAKGQSSEVTLCGISIPSVLKYELLF